LSVGWPRGRRPGWFGPALLAACGGASMTAAHVVTAAWVWPLLAIALLVHLLNRAGSPARAALLGWCFGTGWLVAGVWWLFISMHRYGGLPAPLAALAVFALAAALSLYLALAAAMYARWRRGSPLADALLFAACWLLAEWARAVLFTGFPWVASGYTQVDGPWAALAPWVGVYGIGALLAAAGAGLAVAMASGWRSAAGVAVLVAASLALPAALGPRDFSTSAGHLSVTLIQTNVAQDEKFAAERMPDALAWLSTTLHESRGTLVLAPETAIPLLPGQLADFAPGWWEALQARFADGRQSALVGLPLGDYDIGYTNSVAGLSNAPVYRYDKQHLVPFGEFIPRGFRWFTEAMNIPLGDFARGPLDAPSFGVAGQRIAPNVCYEDLFGEELAVRFVDAAKAPTILANVSNIGWFGDTVALPQHLHISRMRTLELQRPMLRATNTGVTGVIDHRARVTHQLPVLTRGVLDATVEGRNGITPYAAWSGRFGLWPLFGLALAAIAALALSGRRARAARAAGW
jgi:apolipoprotein N-acyltransferase